MSRRIRTVRQTHRATAMVLGIATACCLVSTACDRGASTRQATAPSVEPRLALEKPDENEFPHLHNLLKVSDRIYSGSEPKEEAAFAELRRLGVRTIVSVDGATPKVDLAEKYGMRYVHIPIGYDGVSETAGGALTRLVREAEAPFYVHCHHGKHRGPAAAAVACSADQNLRGTEALEILEAAGTSRDYAGLWRDVKAFRPPPADQDLPPLVEVAAVESMAAAMASIDRSSDNLKLSAAARWRTPPGHPDVVADHEALLVKEGFREVVRQLESDNPYDEAFLQAMRDASASAGLLEMALRSGDHAGANELFKAVQEQCKSCHQEYRD